ncbi:MAG: hypothetical protein H6582_01770 [Crocinitomicaceae bacterium]|nr:hypothetical protein [Crocinitomicaceae bacterium]
MIGLIVATAIACKKQDTNIIYGYECFPTDSGHYVVYDVIDIFHDELLLKHDTNAYQIKEVIGEEDIDLEGDPFKKMYRYKRLNDTLDWVLKDVWALKPSNRSIELVEENKRRIKMVFSISYDQYWNINVFNNDDAENAYYDNIYQPISIGGIDYDSSVTVKQHYFTSYIEHIRAYEIYSPGVGKIYSYRADLDINNGDSTDIYYGTELYYTAKEWGN